MKQIFIAILIVFFSFKSDTIAYSPDLTLEDKLTLWVHKLAVCESGSNPQAINPQDGGSRSAGYIQFKDGTFKHYSERYNLNYSPEDIWDKNKQVTLAVEMLKENPNNYKHWYNCAKTIGKPII